MDEAEWLACADPHPMLEYLQSIGRGSKRKLRLFAVACSRLAWARLIALPSAKDAIDVAEQVADATAGWWRRWRAVFKLTASSVDRQSKSAAVLTAAILALRAWGRSAIAESEAVANLVAWGCDEEFGVVRGKEAALIREIIANPFRPVSVDPAWQTPTVVQLAQAAYEERVLPACILDLARLAVLADALEEAGCTDYAILDHLRGPGPHVPGCWAVDAILGRK